MSLRDRVDRVVHRLVLNRVNTMEEFNRYVSKLQPRQVSQVSGDVTSKTAGI